MNEAVEAKRIGMVGIDDIYIQWKVVWDFVYNGDIPPYPGFQEPSKSLIL
jgi:hypothetical protein